MNYFRRNSLTGAPFPLKLHRKGRLGPTQLPLKWQLLKPRRRRDLGSPAAVNSHFWFRVTFAHLFWTGFDRETFTPYPKSSQKHFQSIFPPCSWAFSVYSIHLPAGFTLFLPAAGVGFPPLLFVSIWRLCEALLPYPDVDCYSGRIFHSLLASQVFYFLPLWSLVFIMASDLLTAIDVNWESLVCLVYHHEDALAWSSSY